LEKEGHEMSATHDADQLSVLDDVRRALGRRTTSLPGPLAPFVEAAAEIDSNTLIEQFVQEATAVRAQVYRLPGEPQLVEAIVEICSRQNDEIALSGAKSFVEMDLRGALAARGLSTFVGDQTEHEALVAKLANCGVGVTAVDYAIAETGTIVLSSDEPNALLVSLLPPVHIALVRSGQMIATMDEAIDRIGRERIGRANPARSVTLVTGPSRTSDVELVLSIGVHGPKELHVIVI
jgi:L-lactate dehydrogenase complex protein LldG